MARKGHFYDFYDALTSSLPSLDARERRGRPSTEDPTRSLKAVAKVYETKRKTAKEEAERRSAAPLVAATAALGLAEKRLLQLQGSDGFWKPTAAVCRHLLGNGRELPTAPHGSGPLERWTTALVVSRLREQPVETFEATNRAVVAAVSALHDDTRLLRSARLALPPRGLMVPSDSVRDGSWFESAISGAQSGQWPEYDSAEKEEDEGDEEDDDDWGMNEEEPVSKDRRFATGTEEDDVVRILARAGTTDSLAVREILRAQAEGKIVNTIATDLNRLRRTQLRQAGSMLARERIARNEQREHTMRQIEWREARKAAGSTTIREGEQVECFWRRPGPGRPPEISFADDAGTLSWRRRKKRVCIIFGSGS